MQAIETTATLGDSRDLVLDEPLPAASRVRIIVLLPDEAPTGEATNGVTENGTGLSSSAATTPGGQLHEIWARIVAEGGELLDEDWVAREVAERRGGTEGFPPQ